jgi:phosphohistidine swiveling domain-containing protein
MKNNYEKHRDDCIVKKTQEYRKLMNRPQNLIESECWDNGERLMLPKKFKDLLFFDPLFIYAPNKAVEIYYNFSDPRQNLQPLVGFLGKNVSWFAKEKVEFDKNCQKIRKTIQEKSTDHAEIFRLIGEVWPMIAVAKIVGGTDAFEVEDDLREICIAIRKESDDVLHPGSIYLTKIIHELIPNKKYIDQILYSEFVNNYIPTEFELTKRLKGWMYHDGRIIFEKEEYFKRKGMVLIQDIASAKITKISGSPAYRGKNTGNVRIIFEMSDLEKIKNGDVLVTPMTTPEMILVMKKAGAIITDEGGITCHAAIVARELKIPCIIGTKIATQVLHDGDLVEVDADKGIVRILEKAE